PTAQTHPPRRALPTRRSSDLLPSGTRRAGSPEQDVVEEVKKELARMQRRYDFIIIAAPTSYVQKSASSIVPAPDVILCARIAHTDRKSTRLNSSHDQISYAVF